MDTVTKELPSTIKLRPERRLSTAGRKNGGPKGNASAKGGDAHLKPMLDVDYDILPHQVGFWVRRAQISIMKSFQFHTQQLDLRPVEAAALLIVGKNPDMSQIVLTSALGTDQSTMVAICTRLEKRGLIERRRLENDRRYQVLNLTRGGVKIAENVRKALALHDESMTKEMSATQRKQLISLLQLLVLD